MSISLNNSTVLVLVNGKKFELTRTRTRNSNSTWLETQAFRLPSPHFLPHATPIMKLSSVVYQTRKDSQ